MKRDSYESIESTKKGFEESFKTGIFYNKQTQDQKHLELILNFLNISPGMNVLDLGTGTGYLAFPIAGIILRQKLQEITDAFHEIHRVLKPNGNMQIKKDGHIKFYTKEEWLKLGELTGFHYTDGFESHIRFPKKKKDAPEFDQIVHRFDPQVTAGYDIEITKDEIWITEKVNNLLFHKIKNEEEYL